MKSKARKESGNSSARYYYPLYMRYKAIPFVAVFVFALFDSIADIDDLWEGFMVYGCIFLGVYLFGFMTQRDIRLFREILLSEEGVIAATVNSKGSGTSVFDRRLILWKELVSYEELDNANATERIISSVNLKGGIAFKMTDEQELVILEELRGYSALVKILKEKTLIGENHNEQI